MLKTTPVLRRALRCHDRRGLTRSDVLVGLAATGCLTAIATVCTAGGNGLLTSKLIKQDAAQQREIHQAMIVFADQVNGVMPRPGLIDRMALDIGGVAQQIPGRGEEDLSKNTTANLYSSLIIQRYIHAKSVVSPLDRNPNVQVDADYDFNRYDPSTDLYWDDAFKADLATESNASYAHLVLAGERVEKSWRNTMLANAPVMGSRGPADGEADARSFTCGPMGDWSGHVTFADNHVEIWNAPLSPTLLLGLADDARQDNIFAMETGPDGSDIILSFTSENGGEAPVLQFD